MKKLMTLLTSTLMATIVIANDELPEYVTPTIEDIGTLMDVKEHGILSEGQTLASCRMRICYKIEDGEVIGEGQDGFYIVWEVED